MHCKPPRLVIPGITFTTGDGNSGYTIKPAAVDGNGNPAPTISTIKSGAYAGMTALATEYTIMTNARTATGREVTLKRTTQTVGIPMFQFGIFSTTILVSFLVRTSISAAVHTRTEIFSLRLVRRCTSTDKPMRLKTLFDRRYATVTRRRQATPEL